MNLKLKTIFSMIEPQWINIADIGCDHAFLSQYNYKNHLNKNFYNVDNKQGPLNNAIKNHDSIINDAKFILSNGIKYFNEQKISIDCCIIAGIGGINCEKILQDDSIYIKNYIFQIENNQQLIDEWIIKNKYEIKEIRNVKVKKEDYLIFKVCKINEKFRR